MEKVLRMLTKLDLQEVPPLVYQLLLLSAKVRQQSEAIQNPLPPSVYGPKCLSCSATFRVVRNRSWMESSLILRIKMYA